MGMILIRTSHKFLAYIYPPILATNYQCQMFLVHKYIILKENEGDTSIQNCSKIGIFNILGAAEKKHKFSNPKNIYI